MAAAPHSFTFRQVREFVDALDTPIRMDVEVLIDLLKEYGHALAMPYAKPVGSGLWELRRTGRPQVRILYGFCRGTLVLLHAFKKDRSRIGERETRIARGRLKAYCE